MNSIEIRNLQKDYKNFSCIQGYRCKFLQKFTGICKPHGSQAVCAWRYHGGLRCCITDQQLSCEH